MTPNPKGIEDLYLDRLNPRIPEESFTNEDDAIKALSEVADLGELVNSIGNAGWMDFEPLIALADGTVVEGNRRLAALKIIRSVRLQNELGIRPPEPLHENAKPDSILVNIVGNRDAAREFIGFKHINGAYKWDSYAKAKFAHDWYESSGDIRLISKKLGDSHNTVSRLVNAYAILKQAENQGFDRSQIEKPTLHFSHLYTALPAPNVRAYLGLDPASPDVLSTASVPKDKGPNLQTFMTWLYGQGEKRALVRSQNPDLGKIVAVLGNSRATSALEVDGRLDVAYEIVEDRANVFAKQVIKMRAAVQEVSRLLGHYDGNADVAENVQDAVDGLEAIAAVVEVKAKKAKRQKDHAALDASND